MLPITKMVVLIVLATTLMSLPTRVYCAAEHFVEVPFNAWCDDVQKLAEIGIIEGYPGGKFGGKGNCTRRDAALVLARALGKVQQSIEPRVTTNQLTSFVIEDLFEPRYQPEPERKQPRRSQRGAAAFGDVPFKRYGDDAIQSLAERGIITGYPRGGFVRKQPITREEFLTMLGRAIAKLPKKPMLDLRGSRICVADVNDHRYSLGPIIVAAGAGVVEGSPEKRLRPRDSLKRWEMAMMVHRLLGLADRSSRAAADNPNER